MQVFDDPLFPDPKRQTQLDYKSPGEDGVQKLVPELSKPVPGKKYVSMPSFICLGQQENDVAHAVNSPPRCPAAELFFLGQFQVGNQVVRELEISGGTRGIDIPLALPVPHGSSPLDGISCSKRLSLANHTASHSGTNQDRTCNPASEKRSAQLWWRKD